MDLKYKCLGERFIDIKVNNFLYLFIIVLNITLIVVLTILLFLYSFNYSMLIDYHNLSYSYLISLIVLNILCIAFSLLSFDKRIVIYANGFIVESILKNTIILYDDIKTYNLKYIPLSYGFILKIYLKNNKKINLHEYNYDNLKILVFKLVDRVL